MNPFYRIAVISCAQPFRPNCTRWITEDPTVVAVFLNGDVSYFADTTPMFGIVPTTPNRIDLPADEWPLRMRRLFGQQQFRALMATRRRGVRVYWEGDDHQLIGNNWDHTVARLNDQHPPTPPATTPQEVLTAWRSAVNGTARIEAGFDNPRRRRNPRDMPSAMAGVPGATPGDFPIRYFSVDFGPPEARTRFVKLDCVSYKSPLDAADDGTKTMLGRTQKAWRRAVTADAVRRGHAQVIMVSSKDLFGLQNDDGWPAYAAERDAELAHDTARGWPVACGDRHFPHADQARIADGAAYDALAVCACPMAVGLTTAQKDYPENVWRADRRPDGTLWGEPLCFEMITVAPQARRVRHAVVEAHTGIEMWAADVPFGAQLPG